MNDGSSPAAGGPGEGGGDSSSAPAGESTVGVPRRRLFKGRRRANTDGESGKRTRRAVITHTESEWLRVQSMAAAMGVSVPRLYERSLHAGDVTSAAKLQEINLQLHSARRGVAGGLNNLNQIARELNTSGELTGELREELFTLARELMAEYDHLNSVIESLPGGGDL